MILLTVPVFFPLVTHLGFDPVYFGIIIVVVVEIGLISPPVGMNMFVMNALLKDVPKLKAILTYHVVSGKVMAKDVKTGAVPTVNGQSINITAGAGGVGVNDAKVTATDVAASNGVIHVVDTVLLPK